MPAKFKDLFTPSLEEPIKTLDIPVAGRGYSAETLPLIFELVNLANEIKVVDAAKKRNTEKPLDADRDGAATSQFLYNTRRLVRLISGTHPSSLGLHPAVYFYSPVGRYQPTSFMAVVSLFKDLDKENGIQKFTSVREPFEIFLLKHKALSNKVAYRYGSGAKEFDRLKGLYRRVLIEFWNGKDISGVEAALRDDPDLAWLKIDIETDGGPGSVGKFNWQTKSAAFLAEALRNPLKCGVCGGLMHTNSISIDHIKARKDGGLSAVSNAQLTHPYCNSIKEKAA